MHILVAKSERRLALWFAGLFAAGVTIVWAVLLVVGSRTSPSYEDAVWNVNLAYLSVNIGGEVLGWQILRLHDPSNIPPDSVAEWPWILTAKFLASFVQGLAYAFMWSVWRRSRDRAAAYLLAIAVIAVAAYGAGVAHFERVNCWGNPTFDGDCDMGFDDGLIWAAVAFGVAFLAVVVVETLVRKASRAASLPR